MSRRFVAFELPGAVRDPLARELEPVRQRCDGLVWTDPAGWHVTVAFVGELPDDRLDALERGVIDGVERAAADGALPRTLSLGDTGRFGDRVLHVTVHDDPVGSVAALGRAVQRQIARSGVDVQEREVRPHVTLARSRRRAPVSEALVEAVGAGRGPGPSWSVSAVGIWSAVPRRDRGPTPYVLHTEVGFPSGSSA